MRTECRRFPLNYAVELLPWALDEQYGLRGTTGNSRKTRSTHAFPKKRAVRTCDTSCRALCPSRICLRAYLEERNFFF